MMFVFFFGGRSSYRYNLFVPPKVLKGSSWDPEMAGSSLNGEGFLPNQEVGNMG